MSERIYHGSTQLFDRFSLHEAGRLSGASNGALGVWVTPEIGIASAFTRDGSGSAQDVVGYVYELAAPEGEIARLPLNWLLEQHDIAHGIEEDHGIDAVIAHYDRIRRDYLAKGYGQIWIMERDGSAPTRIYLDPEEVQVIATFEIGPDREMAPLESAAYEPEPAF